MISLRFNNIENIIKFDERYVNILEIANKNLFKNIVYIINKSVKNIDENKEIIMFDEDKTFDITKEVLVVNDFFNIDLNSTKVLKLVYKDISIKYNLEYGIEDIPLNIKYLYNNIVDILDSYEFNFTYKDEIDIYDLIKILNIKFDENFYNDPYENLMYIFDILSNFKISSIVVLINVKLFFNEIEINEIYKVALYKGIKILLIEYGKESKLLNYESKIYIDEDFDEFEIKV